MTLGIIAAGIAVFTGIGAGIGIGFATYLLVAFMHTRSIKQVSLSEALKVQE